MGLRKATFAVPHRVYTEPNAIGHRQLLYRKGQLVSWDEALEAGLAKEGAVPPELVPFTLPHSVFEEDETGGGRKLVHRAGTVVSLAEAMELGVVGTTEEGGGSGGPDPDPEPDPDADPEPDADADPEPGAGAGSPPDKKDPSDATGKDSPDADKAGGTDGAGQGDPDADKAGASQKAPADPGEGPLKKLTSKGRPTAGA